MISLPDLRPQHRRALSDATAMVTAIGPDELARPTPCTGWTLGTLVGHMIGQNNGFAVALRNGDAEESEYAAPTVQPDQLHRRWRESASRLLAAIDRVEPNRRIRLVEIHRERLFTATVAVGLQLLDTVIHTWDLASSLGRQYRPDDQLVATVTAQARLVPTGAARSHPGSAFGPVMDMPDADPWQSSLALLGRTPPY